MWSNHYCRSKDGEVQVEWCRFLTPKFDLWPFDSKISKCPPQINHHIQHTSEITLCIKKLGLLYGNNEKFKVQIWPRPFDSKIDRVFFRSWATDGKVSSLCQKVIELSSRRDAKLKVQIWPWPFDPNINSDRPPVMDNISVMYYYCVTKRN